MRKRLGSVLAAALAAGTVFAGSIEVDFDPKAEFDRFQTWSWVPGHDQGHRGVLMDATMRERVEMAIVQNLRNAGLRPAEPGEASDILVRYQGDIGSGKTVTTSAGSVANWADPGYATFQYTEMTATLIVDLIVPGTNTLAWRLYVDQKYGGPTDPPGKLRSAFDKGFRKYPPSASERAKKAREIEKRSKTK